MVETKMRKQKQNHFKQNSPSRPVFSLFLCVLVSRQTVLVFETEREIEKKCEKNREKTEIIIPYYRCCIVAHYSIAIFIRECFRMTKQKQKNLSTKQVSTGMKKNIAFTTNCLKDGRFVNGSTQTKRLKQWKKMIAQIGECNEKRTTR